MSAPQKFIQENGVRKLNPEWKKWKAGSSAPTADSPPLPAMKNEMTSLPVVCNTQQLTDLGAGATATQGYEQAMNKYTSMADKIGLPQTQAQDEISAVFAKYEIPMGLLNKMYLLSEFKLIMLLNDDSGSMGMKTDSKWPNGKQMTRWQEMQQLQRKQIELLAYFNPPPIEIHWLNNPKVTRIEKQQNETPKAFIQRAFQLHDEAFKVGTCGATPAKRLIQKSLAAGSGIVRYFYGDGVPSDCDPEDIAKIIRTRNDPPKNPFTFFSCTNQDSDTEWMKSCEEVALNCAENDDYNDEGTEINLSQGKAFPFSYGLWLVGGLVAACDQVLDSLDESAPLTKTTMSELVGYEISDAEYDFYWKEFMVAQNAKRPSSKQDKISKEYLSKWNKEDFRRATVNGDIPAVKAYRKEMLDSRDSGCVIA